MLQPWMRWTRIGRLRRRSSLIGSISACLYFPISQFFNVDYLRRKPTHQAQPVDAPVAAAGGDQKSVSGSVAGKAGKEKEKEKGADAHHGHRHGSTNSTEDTHVAAAAAQHAATQAASAAAAAAVLQSSMKQIESKLERIEKVMTALEKNAAPVPAPVPAGEARCMDPPVVHDTSLFLTLSGRLRVCAASPASGVPGP